MKPAATEEEAEAWLDKLKVSGPPDIATCTHTMLWHHICVDMRQKQVRVDGELRDPLRHTELSQAVSPPLKGSFNRSVLRCSQGRYKHTLKEQVECYECQPGFYMPESNHILEKCFSCDEENAPHGGKGYQNQSGSHTCKLCPYHVSREAQPGGGIHSSVSSCHCKEGFYHGTMWGDPKQNEHDRKISYDSSINSTDFQCMSSCMHACMVDMHRRAL